MIREAIIRANISGEDVDEAIIGHVLQAGVGQSPARQACIVGAIPFDVPCHSVNKVCASGLKAITTAAQSVLVGLNDVCLAGGMESMSRVPYTLPSHRKGKKMGQDILIDGLIYDGLWCAHSNQHMGNCAEKTARELKISREDQDNYARTSAKRALAARDDGIFAQEIVPIPISKGGSTLTVNSDEHLSRLKPSKLGDLKPAFMRGGSVTAGNASPISDGAAAVVLVSGDHLTSRGLSPIAEIISWADGETQPADFAIAPSIAIRKALMLANLQVCDIDLWEINEAFAAVVLANCKLLDIDLDKVNVLGGAISMGHPLGCSGTRIVCTLVTAMRIKGATTGCVSICNGGGGATAVVIRI